MLTTISPEGTDIQATGPGGPLRSLRGWSPGVLCASVLLLAGCAQRLPAGSGGAPGAPRDGVARIAELGRIVPRVDHHQHIMSARAAIPLEPLLPAVQLPPPLDSVLRERNRIMGTAEVGGLFREDAQVLDGFEMGQPWLRGSAAAGGVVRAYDPARRLVPSTFSLGDSVAYVAGVVYRGERPAPDMNFVLGLRKNGRGQWRIATEATIPIPPPPFQEEFPAARLVQYLDDAGIQRAVVLSVAYWFGSPNRTWPGDEYANVRAENDWVAREVARHPERLVGFCSFSPLRDYALQELERCTQQPGMKGLKLHFGSSGVDVHDPDHVQGVRRVFEAANRLGVPIVVHSRGPSRNRYGREEAEIFLDRILPAAPDVPVQIAHLWGGAGFSEGALAAFADAVSAGDPRTRNLYFDLTEVERAAGGSEETLRTIAGRIRQIGLDRVLYGSDMAEAGTLPPALGWARLRARVPLTVEEVRTIANNVAPYLR